MAVGWAWQLLAAPRWWRTLRGAGVTATAVFGAAGMANALAEVDLPAAVSGAATLCLPLAAGWTWRQARTARAIVRLVPLSRLTPASRRPPLVRAAALVIAVGCAADALIYAITLDRAATYACAPFTIDQRVHRWWRNHGGQQGVGCPTGDTRASSTGVTVNRHLENIRAKLGRHRRSELIRLARERHPR